ncbi:MAG: permease [Actinomycetota bacterium]|nr:permease [Actinomycetota bacterium]
MIVDSLREAFFMFWETLWALVLGFTLSGAVQAFVSRDAMERAMGDHKPRTIVRTSLLGAASSSCSYAASALARSLFQRGADFTTAMVFMFASTNLVIELGIVLWLLLGWQFALAELVGGVIMIVLFVLLAPRVLPRAEVEAARERTHSAGHDHGGHEPTLPWRERIRSRAGWSDAAGYTVSDVTMLRRELVIGYVVAGVLAVAVPASFYEALFIPGHGALTEIENVVLGPFIAFISFVCSIGNVPLAAALYGGGISFGGTIAFIFADLVALPLVIIYAKLYGRRLAVRLVLAFWAVMSLAGLLTDLLFRGVGIDAPQRKAEIVETHLSWDYTTFLNIAFLAVCGVVYWLYRQRETGGAYAQDPVCGMQVEKAHPGATTTHEGQTVYFCAPRCADRFTKDPIRYAGSLGFDAMDASPGQVLHQIGLRPPADQDGESPSCH